MVGAYKQPYLQIHRPQNMESMSLYVMEGSAKNGFE